MKLLITLIYFLTFDLLAWENIEFQGEKDTKIVFTKFGNSPGTNGSILISTGRTEAPIKYENIAHNFINAGFSPIYVINHRGQGFSQRMLNDPHKGYVENFSHYYEDFNKFVEIVKNDPDTNLNKMYLLAHSMGGAIATGYLQNFKNSFRKIAYTSPMFGIKLDKSELLTLAQTAVSCYTPFGPECIDYVPGGGAFNFGKVNFETNELTRNEEEYHKIYETWSLFPELQLGSATLRWVREAIQANRVMRKSHQLTKMKNVKVLLLQAGEDKIVDNERQNEVCNKINQIKPRNCKKVTFKNSFHEILIEKDSVRFEAQDKIIEFYKN